MNNNNSLICAMEYMTNNIMLTVSAVNNVNRNPENLFLILIKILLKNDMIDPIITTG
jgi:hypothetical protein